MEKKKILAHYFYFFFGLATCMDPKVKVEGAKNIFNFIAIFTNQPSQLKGILYEQLNTYMNIMKLNIVILFIFIL